MSLFITSYLMPTQTGLKFLHQTEISASQFVAHIFKHIPPFFCLQIIYEKFQNRLYSCVDAVVFTQGSPLACQHQERVNTRSGKREAHNNTLVTSLQATGSSLMACPHQYGDQPSTSIFHLLRLLFPPIPQHDSLYPAYQTTRMAGRWWR